MYGRTGRNLRVNLTENDFTIEESPAKFEEFFLGGRGLGVKVLSDEIEPGIDPLSIDNKIIFVSGPLVGTGAITGASCNVVTKSALSGTIACAKLRGHFGAELKFAGFDMIIVEGKADSPVILSIMDDKINIQPALEYWGRTASETEETFKKSLGDKWAGRETYLVSIGPAGEKLLPLANIINDGFLSVGGAGIGAVMGSKNLKAIAVKGNHTVTVADGNRFVQVVTTLINKLNSAPLTSQSMSSWGSAFFVDLCHQKGILPFKNFQGSHFAEIRGVGAGTMPGAFELRSRGCFACPIACIKKTDVSNPLFKGKGMAPTYLAAGALGYNCGITDMTIIGMANMLCAEMGLDPIAAGGTVATAMELVEKGIVSKDDLKLDLRFGHGDDLLQALTLMATKKGHAKRIGQGAKALTDEYREPKVFMGVRGIPLAPFDPRAIQGMGLHFATSNYGPHHLYAYTFIEEILNVHENLDPWTIEGKPELVKRYQDMTAVMDSLGLCNWPLMGLKFNNFVPMVNSCLGTGYKAEDLLAIGERIWNIERSFNLKTGLDPKYDVLPERFTKEPILDGPAEGQVSRVDEMLPEYYSLRGWNDEGRPDPDKLKDLGLGG
ncbi:MAG: aldehyde ferredoxin oxidoreductase family protein [Desulfobacteraceae bacterium]|uniref:Aldehyde ferredoxin oxidoreductase family protein n=1 Tax=Candidatus Desulfacyla euxinica TaxID=2841693 RepID=A0A8J6N3R4_9DELT|nr:aldehyde ferredoxin oxidoreductase family protein [Candidatus Desulfacyla euxinica]MBL6978702.1 aldehyde ferredoxin oxidoreductase family protein [Desulfobacteraceae bacterium]